MAGAAPDEIDYVEAHGTGTSLGDPIEVCALSAALAGQRLRETPLLVGSVKTNIGHLEAAAGVAGVIKVVLALEHGSIPPHLHFQHPNPHIPWKECNVAVTSAEHPWRPGARPRIAGVSSFGFSGTNAHAIIQEAPPTDGKNALARAAVLSLSASIGAQRDRSCEARCTICAGLAEPIVPTIRGRRAYRRRGSVALAAAPRGRGGHCEDGGRRASGLCRRPLAPALHVGTATSGHRPEVVFVFSGRDAAYPGMGRRLYDASSAYREAVDQCDRIIGPDAFGQTLKSVLWQVPNNETLSDELVWSRLILFVAQYAAARLWKSFGVEPAAVIGDGDGEFAAAYVAGVFSLEDALRVVAERGRVRPGVDSSLEVWAESVPALPPCMPVAWTAGSRRPTGARGCAGCHLLGEARVGARALRRRRQEVEARRLSQLP